MNTHDFLQLVIYFVLLILLVKPLGLYVARVYQGERTWLDRAVKPSERLIYRVAGIDILLPLSLMLAIALVSQGVVQTFSQYQTVSTLQSGSQVIAVGPAASQIAIKQLGTNGGGVFSCQRNCRAGFSRSRATRFACR